MIVNRLNSVGKRIVSQIRFKSRVSKENYPVLNPEDLEEKFTLGSGPGGQAVNRTANAVFLKHVPSGLWVKCHQTRSIESNRKIARQLLLGKLDNHLNGENSVEIQQKILDKLKLDKKKEKTRLKYEQKKLEKEQTQPGNALGSSQIQCVLLNV